MQMFIQFVYHGPTIDEENAVQSRRAPWLHANNDANANKMLQLVS